MFTYSPPALADARPEPASPERERAEGREAVRAPPRYSVECEDGTPEARDPHQAVGRADEEVNPPDNPLATVQPCGDGVFGAELAAGPRGRDPRKESLERNTESLRVERKWRSLSGKKVRYGPFVVEDPRV